MAVRIHQLAITPYQLVFTATSSVFDLSTTSAGKFHVRRPDGVLDTWTATISGAAVGSVVLSHVFQPSTGAGDEADVAQVGEYDLYAEITLAGPSTVYTVNFPLIVFDPYTGAT